MTAQREKFLGFFMQMNFQIVTITYEDLVSNSEKAVETVLSAINVSNKRLPSDANSMEIRKQQMNEMRDVILNYDELKLHFCGTKWHFLFS